VKRSVQQAELDEATGTGDKSNNGTKKFRPALPKGTQIISIPVVELAQDDPNAQVSFVVFIGGTD
jgi:hypothetical protein